MTVRLILFFNSTRHLSTVLWTLQYLNCWQFLQYF